MNSILAAVARPNDHRLLMIGGVALIIGGLWTADDGLNWQTVAVATVVTLVAIGLAAGMVRILMLRSACGPNRP